MFCASARFGRFASIIARNFVNGESLSTCNSVSPNDSDPDALVYRLGPVLACHLDRRSGDKMSGTCLVDPRLLTAKRRDSSRSMDRISALQVETEYRGG